MRRIRWRTRKPNPFNRLRLLAGICAIVVIGSFPETQQLGEDFAATARNETLRVKAAIELHEASK